MNRRSFFRFLGAGAATLALSEAIPFGRVWSFPSKIVVPDNRLLSLEEISQMYLASAARELAEEMDREFRRDLAFMTGDKWPVLPARRTTITLNRMVGVDFEFFPA